jgi:predicted amidohydrolase YtcJ
MATLYRNGRVYSPADPLASALLVDGERVAFVGSDSAAEGLAADGLAADHTVDLDGALVTPGFVDAHVHTTQIGLTATGLDLRGTVDRQAVLDLVGRHAQAGALILGHGWDESGWSDQSLPTPSELDRAAGGAPAYLTRVDTHSALASPALRAAVPGLAGLAGYTETGPLTTDAHHAVRRVALTRLTPERRAAAQRAARELAASQGIVALHECGGPEIGGEDDFTGLLALAAAEPGPEVFGYWGEWCAPDKARELGAVGAGGDLFVDGALGSHTAAVTAPYVDVAGDGLLYLDADAVAAHLVACADDSGLQAGFHAIGDDGFAAAAGKVGLNRIRAGRHRIEHAEMLDPLVIRGLVEYGIVASVQPAFDAAWGGSAGMYAQRLGAERALALNPFAALAGVGVPLAFGSDAPVTPLDPWGAVRAAAHHRNPRHSISGRAAFAAHTRGGWRALGRDDGGMLVPGAVASFAVWEPADPRSGRPGLPDLAAGSPRCRTTVVKGRMVFNGSVAT